MFLLICENLFLNPLFLKNIGGLFKFESKNKENLFNVNIDKGVKLKFLCKNNLVFAIPLICEGFIFINFVQKFELDSNVEKNNGFFFIVFALEKIGRASCS